MRPRPCFMSIAALLATAALIVSVPIVEQRAVGSVGPSQSSRAIELRVGGQLGGGVAAVAADEGKIYAGVGPRIVVLDMTGGGDPEVVAVSELLPANVTSLAAQEGMVFAGYGIANEGDPNGVAVVDGLTSGTAPVLGQVALLGVPVGVQIQGDSVLVVTRLQVEDERPYPTPTVMPFPAKPEDAPQVVTYRGGEIVAIDVADPSAPTVASDFTISEVPFAVETEGARAFVLAGVSNGGWQLTAALLALDWSDGRHPALSGSLELGGQLSRGTGLELDREHAYVVTGDLDPGLVVVDVRDPENLALVGSVRALAQALVLVDHHLYASDVLRTWVYDVADPANPALVSELRLSFRHACAIGDRLVVVEDGVDRDRPMGNWAGVGIFGLGPDPMVLERQGRWRSLVDMTSVGTDGDFAYVTVGSDQLLTIDASDVQEPKLLAVAPWSDSGWSLVSTRTAVGRGFVAMTDPSSHPSSLYVASLADTGVGEPAASVFLEAHAVDLAAAGELLVVAVEPAMQRYPGPTPEPEDTALRVFDAGEPAELGLVASALLDTPPVGVAMGAGSAFVAVGSELRVYDVTQPAAPELVTTVSGVRASGGYQSRPLALSGERLAVVTSAGVRLFDVSSPDDPREVGTVRTGNVKDVALSDQWLFTVETKEVGTDIVVAYELDAAGTYARASFSPPSDAVSIAVQGDMAIVVTKASGIYWLRVDEADRATDEPEQPTQTPQTRWQRLIPYAANLHIPKDVLVREPLSPLGGCTRELVATRARNLALKDVAIDGRGTTWFATGSGAVGLLADGSWLVLLQRDGLAYDDVTSIAIDVNGSPWFGSRYRYRETGPYGDVHEGGGLTGYYYPVTSTWRNTGGEGPGGMGSVLDVAVDTRDQKWVVTGMWEVGNYVDWGAVYRLGTDRTWDYFPAAAGVDLSKAERIVADAAGNVWVDTWEGVVLRTAEGVWTRSLGPGAPDARAVGFVTADRSGRTVWLVGQGAFYHRRTGESRWQHISTEADWQGRGAHTLAQDGLGNVWWASEVAAGVIWAGGSPMLFQEPDIFGDSYIDWIELDQAGDVWFRVSSKELVRLQCR